MHLQIANPIVVRKIEQLAKATGLSKTGAVERAVDSLLGETQSPRDSAQRMAALLEQLDRIPDRPDAFDPLEWDAAAVQGRGFLAHQRRAGVESTSPRIGPRGDFPCLQNPRGGRRQQERTRNPTPPDLRGAATQLLLRECFARPTCASNSGLKSRSVCSRLRT